MSATAFQVGDTLRSLTDQQNLEKGCLYQVTDVSVRYLLGSAFVTYMVRDVVLDREWGVRNAHLLMERVA
jgi:hypothetical protein